MKKIYSFFLGTLFLSGIQVSAQTFATPPYSTGFESGSLDASWVTASSLATGEIFVTPTIPSASWGDAVPHTGTYFLGMHHPSAGGGAYNLNEAWLHLDLSGGTQYDFEFWWAEWNDETEAQDGVYLSDDGGASFTKVVDLDGAAHTDLQWYFFSYDLDSMAAANGLSLTANFVIKFQQYDNYYFAGGNDGFMFDDISITAVCTGPSFSTYSDANCGTYTVPSGDETYTSSGVYNDTIPNFEGCDSIMTIDVTVYPIEDVTLTEETCDTYTMPSGTIVSTTGVYYDTLTTINGCDSLITVDLTVNTVDATTSQTGVTLTANASGLSYQWVDCGNAYAPIAGATNQTFVAGNNGSYAVIVTDGACSDTSDCMTVASANVGEFIFDDVTIYPNPSTLAAPITVGLGTNKIDEIVIYNVLGEVVYSIKPTAQKVIIPGTSLEKGTYILKITNAFGSLNKSFVIQ